MSSQVCRTASMNSTATNARDSTVARERIIYLAPDHTDAAVKKRAHGFLVGGHDLLSFSFHRDRYDQGGKADWPNIGLGKSTERRLISRVLLGITSLWTIFRHGRRWRSATMIYARNLDLALLGVVGKWLTWSHAPLIYEVLDIHPLLLGKSWRSAIARQIERWVLARSRLLVVSSPAFVKDYFQAQQKYDGHVLLLENKWTRESIFASDCPDRNLLSPNIPVWTIGWFGNLRCRESLHILRDLADSFPDRVHIYMRGCDSLLDPGELEEVVGTRSNMVFDGEYRAPEEIVDIYSRVHFNWCVDLADGDNSRWLIPNRVYEGGYCGIPAIAIEEFETGRVVRERGLGIVVRQPAIDQLKQVFASLTEDAYVELRRRVSEVDLTCFVEDRDIVALIREQLA